MKLVILLRHIIRITTFMRCTYADVVDPTKAFTSSNMFMNILLVVYYY